MIEQPVGPESLSRPAEPVVRPAGMPPHNAHVVRRARLFADGHALVVRDFRLRERRYAVGADGIRRAVFFPPGDLWETVQKRPSERWGVLVFKGEDGRDILHVPLAAWLPEAGVVGALELRPSACLGRTGLRALATELGIPLEESDEPFGPGTRDGGQRGRPDRADHAELPRWHSWVRGLGMFGWIVAVVMAFAADLVWAMPVAAGALFLLPASDIAVRIGAWWRNRRQNAFAEAVEIRPSPEAGGDATERFLRTAVVRVLPHDIVLTDTLGEERWLARVGEHGVARLVRLVVPTTGEILGVEFRDRNGDGRALLPWNHWFAGPQGDEHWDELVRALNVPVSDVKHEQTEGAKDWWQGLMLAAEVRVMSPMGAGEARKQTDWYRSVIGRNELLSLPLFSAVLLAGIFSDMGPAILAGCLSALTITVVLVPSLISALVSRFWYDRALGES
ncbi:hypothetical protein SUDANB15_04224 [Streptomyces sp. enrichment culture]|uniref:hypothetical protein n=1 Tax=Streptomyces sp. enrichment culture TaxID=1795815 RepID=UPI003F54EEBD